MESDLERYTPFTDFLGSRRKRTHDDLSSEIDQMSFNLRRLPSPRPREQRSTQQVHRPSEQRRRQSVTSTDGGSPFMLRRFVGDGLDLRRPINLASRTTEPPSDQTVIDLTTDDAGEEEEEPNLRRGPLRSATHVSNRASRPPRFPADREIIDLSNDSPEFGRGSRTQNDGPATQDQPVSPEVEFLTSRPRSRPTHSPHRRHLPPPQPPPRGRGLMHRYLDDFDLDLVDGFADQDEEDDVIFTGATRLLHPPGAAPLGNGLGPAAEYIRRRAQGRHAALDRARRLLENHGHHLPLNFQMPMPDFDVVAFDMGREDSAPAPTYDAPPDASPGFTRSPKDGEVIICPNCNDELCTGDDEVKKQVWVIKACGHLYCGECTVNRAKSKRPRDPKGKRPANALPPPFHMCVVEGCGKKVNTKSTMVQLFL